MTDRPPHPDIGDESNREPTTGAPRWVKVFGAIALVLVVLFVVVLVIGGGHGPGRHTRSGGPDGHFPPASVTS